MRLNKQFVDGMLDVKESLTLKDICSAINYSLEKGTDDIDTYEFQMGVSIATLDTREVLYDMDTKSAVRLFDPQISDMDTVDTMYLMLPVQKELLTFCKPTVANIMASRNTLVTFNKPYLLNGVLHLVFVVYITSLEIEGFMSHIDTNCMVFRKNFTQNDFTEMNKESKLFIDSIQISNKGE